MGLEEIIEQVNKDASAKANEVLERAQSDALKIIDQAKDEAAQYIEEQKTQSDGMVKQFLLRESSRATAEAKEAYRDKVSELVASSFSLLMEELKRYANSDDYTKLIAKLAAMAAEDLGSSCTLYLLKKDVKKIKLPAGVLAGELKEISIGGLNGVSNDGRLSVDFTLENIVDMLRSKISAEMLAYAENGDA